MSLKTIAASRILGARWILWRGGGFGRGSGI